MKAGFLNLWTGDVLPNVKGMRNFSLWFRRLRFIFTCLVGAAAVLVAALYVIAHISFASGYYFTLFGNDLGFSTKTNKKYAFFTSDYFEISHYGEYSSGESYVLYSQVDRFGFLWKKIDTIHAGYTWNNLHDGTDLVVSPDGKTLFVRRNTNESPIWSDVLDISVDPPRTVVQGLDCCYSSGEPRSNFSSNFSTDEEELQKRSTKVVEIARSMGAYR